MDWHRHSAIEGQHAFLGASKYHWINYDSDKLFERFSSSYIPTIGTILHALAKSLIDKKVKLTKADKKVVLLRLLENGVPRSVINMDFIYENLMNYVNDCIGFGMDTEVTLMYSEYAFGTADAINFRDDILRIHDLKTGAAMAHVEQLYIYAALFCLEYRKKPGEIKIYLSIYQDGEVFEEEPDVEVIAQIMDKIITFDKAIRKFKGEV